MKFYFFYFYVESGKAVKKSAPAPTSDDVNPIERLDLRVGKILKAEKVRVLEKLAIEVLLKDKKFFEDHFSAVRPQVFLKRDWDIFIEQKALYLFLCGYGFFE